MGDDRDEAPTAAAVSPRAGASGSDLWRMALRRRRFLVDRRYQLRASLIAVGVAVLLLVLLNVSLFVGGGHSQDPSTSSPDRAQTTLVLVGSLVFLAGVFLVSVLETHRTAGAARSLVGTLERFRRGEISARAALRRGDNLHEVAAAFNALAGALHERRSEETERLAEIASALERGGSPAEAAAALRHWIEGSSTPASAKPLARSAQASHPPQGRPPSAGS